MIPIKKNLILTILVGVMILLMTPTSMFPRLCANGSGGGYSGGDGTGDVKTGYLSIGNAIEMYVITGAGYYLNAYSDILVFLNRVEESDLKGMDYSDAQQILDQAIDNMTNAVMTYYYLIRRAERTPYKEIVISKLMEFDYAGFLVKWGLNSVVLKKVEEYLQKGDITGMYKHLYAEFTTITAMLVSVREEISLGMMPELSDLWKLNERCSETLLFGQYVSRVFYAVL